MHESVEKMSHELERRRKIVDDLFSHEYGPFSEAGLEFAECDSEGPSLRGVALLYEHFHNFVQCHIDVGKFGKFKCFELCVESSLLHSRENFDRILSDLLNCSRLAGESRRFISHGGSNT